MSHLYYPILLFCCLISCAGNNQQIKHINPNGNQVAQRFNPPPGFKRLPVSQASFGYYLQHLVLKPHGAQVHYYNGQVKTKPNVYCAVADIDVGNKDLQQCADAVMRLRAEYLFAANKKDLIHFNFTNGFRADFSKWLQGYRIQVKGNQVQWVKSALPTPINDQYKDLKKYLQIVFTYAGTLSLDRELKPVSHTSDLEPGDVFIKGGSPGHAVIVLDAAQNSKGEKVFLLAQSYMPAQEIQVLVNPEQPELSPWYKADDTTGNLLTTPEWSFEWNQLKRFQQ